MNKIFWTKLYYYYIIFFGIASYIIYNINIAFTDDMSFKIVYLIMNPFIVIIIFILSDKRILNGLLHSMKTTKERIKK